MPTTKTSMANAPIVKEGRINNKMAITIKREKNERGVKLNSLKLGDTFLYDNRVGVIAARNGHHYPMDFATCCEMHRKADFPYGPLLGPDSLVLPVAVEMTYKVIG